MELLWSHLVIQSRWSIVTIHVLSQVICVCLIGWQKDGLVVAWESRRAYICDGIPYQALYVMTKLVVVSIFLVHPDWSRHVSEVDYEMSKCWILGGELMSGKSQLFYSFCLAKSEIIKWNVFSLVVNGQDKNEIRISRWMQDEWKVQSEVKVKRRNMKWNFRIETHTSLFRYPIRVEYRSLLMLNSKQNESHNPRERLKQ